MPEITFHNPEALGKPLGQYSQITRVKASEFLFIAGQVAAEKSGACVGKDDFDAQCRQVFANIEAALKSQSAGFANVVEFTTYLCIRRTSQNSWRSGCVSFHASFRAACIPPTRS